MMTPDYANDPQFQAMKEYYRKYNVGTDWKKNTLAIPLLHCRWTLAYAAVRRILLT